MIFDNFEDFNFVEKKLFDLKLRLKQINIKLEYTVNYDKLEIIVKDKNFKSKDEFINFIKFKIEKINNLMEEIQEEKKKYDIERNIRLNNRFFDNLNKVNLKRIDDFYNSMNDYSGIVFILEVDSIEKKFYLLFENNPGLKEMYEKYFKSLFNTEIIDFLKSKINEKDFLKNNIL